MGRLISRRHILAGVTGAASAGLFQVGAGPAAQQVSPMIDRLSAVPTFNSIGLYWRPSSGAPDREASVTYRRSDEAVWSKAHDLWFDERNHDGMRERSREYRGSIAGLQAGTDYEIELHIAGGESARTSVMTWSEEIPFKNIVPLPPVSHETVAITESGSPDGYVLYTPMQGGRASIDVADTADYNVIIDASYVVIRGLELRNARRHAILLRRRAHHVVIEDNDIS